MGDPMRIRAQLVGDKTTVKAVINHEMETGLRRGGDGKVVPAHFIQTISAQYNGKIVMSAQWGPAVSKNPFLQFTFTGGKIGDKVSVTWIDNKDDKRTDEAVISA
jgi:sulfur-oxidizing protein SoxZ